MFVGGVIQALNQVQQGAGKMKALFDTSGKAIQFGFDVPEESTISPGYQILDIPEDIFVDTTKYYYYNDGEFEVYDPPTPEEIQFILAAKKLEEYREYRRKEYPDIGDQLDALFHAGVFPEEMASQIQAVKDKYPKPE